MGGLTSPLCDGGVNYYKTKDNRDESGLLQADVSEDCCNSSELDHEGIALVLRISNAHTHNFPRFYGNQHMSALCCIHVTSRTTELT